jgi:hypothetical protein
MSKDLEVFEKEGARVVFLHLHAAHEMYVAKIAALAAISNLYDQPDSSLWNTDTGACNLYQVTDCH